MQFITKYSIIKFETLRAKFKDFLKPNFSLKLSAASKAISDAAVAIKMHLSLSSIKLIKTIGKTQIKADHDGFLIMYE